MIILSERSVPEDVIASLRENAFSYFHPPFDPVLLADMVYQVVSEPCWDDGLKLFPNWIRLMARCTLVTAEPLGSSYLNLR